MASVCDAWHMRGGQEHTKRRKQRIREVGLDSPQLSSAPGVLVKNARTWAASQAWKTGP